MSQPAEKQRAERHDPFAALRQRNFLYYGSGRIFSGMGQAVLQATIAWHVYKISGSALQLGVLGLVRFLPALCMSLPGGVVADSFDRRRVLMAVQGAPLFAALVLLFTTANGSVSLPLIYALVFLLAVFSPFENPARQALLPQVVTPESFPNAVTVNATVQQLAQVVGPALAGLIIATGAMGVQLAYGVDACLVLGTVLSVFAIKPVQRSGPRRSMSFVAMWEGVQFVRQRRVLYGAMTLDLLGVIFAGATALLPIYALKILHVGAAGYGLLTASLSVGAFVASLLLVSQPQVKRTGRTMLWAVAAYGGATMLFGFSRWFPLSLLAYALTGAADQTSLVMRQTTLQLAAPNELRGRVTAVHSLFTGASGQIGGIESGFVAAISTVTFSVISGGAICAAIAALMAAWNSDLRQYSITEPPRSSHTEPAAALAVADLPASAAESA